MFSPFTPNLLSPKLSARLDSLFKCPYQFENHWDVGDSMFNPVSYRSLDDSKRLNSFYIYMNVNQFKPSEIDVSLVDGFVVIQAKQEERHGVQNFSCREFKRQYKLPDDIDTTTLSSTLNKNGLLIVKVNTYLEETSNVETIIVPEELQGSSIDCSLKTAGDETEDKSHGIAISLK